MSTVTDAQAVIGTIDGVDGVYPNMLPGPVADDTAKTVILLTEATGESPDEYGSDKATRFRRAVAVNIFYGLSKSDQASAVEEAIFNAFEAAGWGEIYSAPHTFDPSTGQYTKAFQFANTKER
ncbi:MAG: DUF806 family protein [Lactobacillus sp.]|jgi:hypothetical protein|nr:DUF806 family protein [Lactobacillus sp.]MCI2032062.1 DUF806 family protein [Lactobacillus sp.]